MFPPGEKPNIGHPTRMVPRDTARSTITPLDNNPYDKMTGSSPPSRAGVPIPNRKRSGSQNNGSEKSSIRESPPRPQAFGRAAGKVPELDPSSITLPYPMGSSPPRSPPSQRLSRRPSVTSTTIVGDGSVFSAIPTQDAESHSLTRRPHVRKPSADQIGLGLSPSQSRATPSQDGKAHDGHARDRNQRVPGGSWSAQDVPEMDAQPADPIPRQRSGPTGGPSYLTASRPIAKVDTRVPRAFLSPLAQTPIQFSDSGGEWDDDTSSRLSRCVSSLAPSRRGSIAPDVDKVENNIFPVFKNYYELHGVVCRRDLSRLSRQAKVYLEQLVEAEQIVAGSAGSICYAASYNTAAKALGFSRQLMSSYFDTIEVRAKEKNCDEVLATGYQLMEMTMSNFRNVLQTVELEKEMSNPAAEDSETIISTAATIGHDVPKAPAEKKASVEKKPGLFDRIRKVSLGCIAALDISFPPTPVAKASRGPYQGSNVTLETRTVRESSIYTPSLASETLGWDYMFLSPVTDGSPQSLNVRASLALFPDADSKRPDLPTVKEEELDVVRGEDGSVTRATVRGLIRIFTEPTEMVKNDMADLIDAFFLFSPTFTTAQALFELIMEQEGQRPPRGLNEQLSTAWKVRHDGTRIYVAHLICLWLESHWDKGLDKQTEADLLARIGVLSSRFAADQGIPVEIAHQLIDSIRNRGSWADKEKARTEANIAEDMYSEALFRGNLDQIVSALTRPEDWNALDITYFHDDGGPEMIARQLTAMEAELFHSFQPRELIEFEDRDLQRKLENWRQFSEALTLWVTKSVVQHSDVTLRAKAVTVFVTVAAVCKSMRNYSSALSIYLGLTTVPVKRLILTNDTVLRYFKDIRDELGQFFTGRSNFVEYRAELPVNLPTVPLEVTILRDIKTSREILLHDGKFTAQHTAAPTEQMIALKYYRNMRRTIRDLEKCRGEYTTLNKVDVVYDWIKHNTDQLKGKVWEECISDYKQMSLKAEPYLD
ncbi:ras guanine nucleotide exchange factor domain-containing protein [Fomitopsis serialis]|uniref:ras guanine nucleotide exchange factor domain-containing protein n=1 Tax=Fomitopsis serialis TaxID=139415 RepID=UPI0020082BCA|nr:ras guanine nucleotide exchange factor domain-containing protein [Neoantrodia serialis]KAH9936401.1 ras guanine nucleotide exchange factor domain-containing protein [Neoantrodia serialis]